MDPYYVAIGIVILLILIVCYNIYYRNRLISVGIPISNTTSSSPPVTTSSSTPTYTVYNGIYTLPSSYIGFVNQCSGSQVLPDDVLVGSTSSSCALSTLADAQTMCNSIPSCTGILMDNNNVNLSNPYVLLSGTTATASPAFTTYVKST